MVVSFSQTLKILADFFQLLSNSGVMPMILTWCICIYIYLYIYVYIYIFVNTHRCCFETVSLWSCFLLSKPWNLCENVYVTFALEYIRSLEVCPDFRWQEHFPLPPNLRPRPTFALADHVGLGSNFYGCWGSVNLKASPYHTTILNHPAVFHLRTPSSKQIRWTTVINGKDEWLGLGVRWWINDLL